MTKKEAELNKELHDSVQGLLSLSKKGTEDSSRPPASSNLSNLQNSRAQQASDRKSQVVQVPIDEVQAIGVHLSPTYALDDVQSVTLKSFRKVVGYDTFNSILKKDRDEKKDPADYYNVTVSMMIKRNQKDEKVYVKPTFGDDKKTLG